MWLLLSGGPQSSREADTYLQGANAESSAVLAARTKHFKNTEEGQINLGVELGCMMGQRGLSGTVTKELILSDTVRRLIISSYTI